MRGRHTFRAPSRSQWHGENPLRPSRPTFQELRRSNSSCLLNLKPPLYAGALPDSSEECFSCSRSRPPSRLADTRRQLVSSPIALGEHVALVDAPGARDALAVTDPTIVRSRPVRLDARLITTIAGEPGARLVFELFEDLSVAAVVDHVQRRSVRRAGRPVRYGSTDRCRLERRACLPGR